MVCKLYIDSALKKKEGCSIRENCWGFSLRNQIMRALGSIVLGPSKKPGAWNFRNKCKNRSEEILIFLLWFARLLGHGWTRWVTFLLWNLQNRWEGGGRCEISPEGIDTFMFLALLVTWDMEVSSCFNTKKGSLRTTVGQAEEILS